MMLLTALLKRKAEKVQSIVMAYPMGLNRLVALLGDASEVIRNETLLLLEALTHHNPNIQKIVAFEGCFDHLFRIVSDEGSYDGGIIVEDCLRLINNLLDDNLSNQNFFREMGCLARLPSLLKPTRPHPKLVPTLSLVLTIVRHIISSLHHKVRLFLIFFVSFLVSLGFDLLHAFILRLLHTETCFAPHATWTLIIPPFPLPRFCCFPLHRTNGPLP
jgi:hypothetical protein